jgi:bifunctional enzyme CysN/CysC
MPDIRSTAQRQQALYPQERDLLKLIVCGSVDDGKSTLIGRMLYDSNVVLEDQLATLKKDSKKYHNDENIDFSLLVDGLKEEREQGITIDLSHRFFDTPKRRYMVIDSPGHEQYTRAMAAGASIASVGIILVDATKGISIQTKRHAYILYLMGVRDFVLCVNKMDLMGYSESTFKLITHNFDHLMTSITTAKECLTFYSLPVSAVNGCNIFSKSMKMPWFKGKPLFSYLETLSPQNHECETPVMQVQRVSRPDATFRGYMGTISGGTFSVGHCIKIFPGGQKSHIKDIVTFNNNLHSASVNDAITLTLEDEISISRGDVITSETSSICVADQFCIRLLSITDEVLYSGRSYIFKFGHKIINGVLSTKKRLDLEQLKEVACQSLCLNEFGIGEVYLTHAIPFMPYQENKSLGSFLIIDRITKQTLGIGMILFDLHRSNNIFQPITQNTETLRAEMKGQKPCVLWLTGLSGAGKSTIANLVESKLYAQGKHTYLIDGDAVRKGLCSDLGFSCADRIQNIRRIAYLSKHMVDAGLITLVAAISPFRSERLAAKDLFESGQFIEIYVKASLSACTKRDPKGLYAKHNTGHAPNFTGIDSPYEPPLEPDLVLDTEVNDAEACANKIINHLLQVK